MTEANLNNREMISGFFLFISIFEYKKLKTEKFISTTATKIYSFSMSRSDTAVTPFIMGLCLCKNP